MRKENESRYIGHSTQIQRMEEHILKGGKGDGMRLLEVVNGNGLQFTVSLDRCADIARLSYKGINMGYFAPCGYVAPQYYDAEGFGFLKSFTAGFMTTCGLTNVGGPCEDDGETLPQHGVISNSPADTVNYWTDKEGQHIVAEMKESRMFSHQLTLKRRIDCPAGENFIEITDTVVNDGSRVSPLMLLYHCNIGYPLLTEEAQVYLPSVKPEPSSEHAAKDVDTWNLVLPPQDGFSEQCYFHTLKKTAEETFAAIYNPYAGAGVVLEFNLDELNCLTEWKMMGNKEYVMGLEPGACYPIGRAKERENGTLQFLAPGEEKVFHLRIRVLENDEQAESYRAKL